MKSEKIVMNRANNYHKLSWKNGFKQIIASCIAHSLVIQCGINLSFSSILLPQLEGATTTANDIQITESDASWIASIMALSMPCGSITIGPLMDRYGRRTVCLATCIPFAISWLIQAAAANVWHVYVGRAVGGFCAGLSATTLVYVTEIAHPTFRTMLLNLSSVFISLGILITCVLGTLLNWRHLALVNCTLVTITFIGCWLIPESPHWYMVFGKGNRDGMVRSLKWLYRGNTQLMDEQASRIASTVPVNAVQRVTESGKDDEAVVPMLDRVRKLTTPAIYRPFIVLTLIFTIQQLSGGYVFIFYTVNIFKEVVHSGEKISPYVYLILVGCVRFLLAIISAILAKNCGRRPMLIVSGVGMAVTAALAAVNWSNTAPWALLGYVCFASLGYLVVPWTLIGELLPVRVRGRLGGVLVSFAYLWMFVAVKVFPHALAALGLCWILVGMVGVNVCGVVYVWMCLPETLGKNFEEIEAYFLK